MLIDVIIKCKEKFEAVKMSIEIFKSVAEIRYDVLPIMCHG